MKQTYRQFWLQSYKKDNPPHWATSLEPSRLVKKFASELIKNKLHKEPVLEIGCGNGRDSLFLCSKGFDVVGIDVCAQAVVLARKNKRVINKQAVSGRIVFKNACAEKLPFANQSFGSIYSIGVLHCADLELGMKEIARVLKPGGIAMIHVWQKTVFLKTGTEEELCSSARIVQALNNTPLVLKSIRENITMRKIDTDEGKKDPHMHYAIIFTIKKPLLRKTVAVMCRKGKSQGSARTCD